MSFVYGIDSDGPSVILTNNAFHSMIRYRQMSINSKEAGGQLFARFEGCNTFIVEATEPKVLDRRSRYGFIPSRWLQRMEIKSQHKRGNHFVGDWHTHPQPVPSPSNEDINSMVDCYRKSCHELKAFLMVIVGTAEPPENFFVCLVNGNGISRLKVISTGR